VPPVSLSAGVCREASAATLLRANLLGLTAASECKDVPAFHGLAVPLVRVLLSASGNDEDVSGRVPIVYHCCSFERIRYSSDSLFEEEEEGGGGEEEGGGGGGGEEEEEEEGGEEGGE